MTYKEILERAVAKDTFILEQCLDIEENINENIKKAFKSLCDNLSSKLYKKFKAAIVRSSFLIELTNPTADTDSTKYQVHWVEVLKTQKDVRYARSEERRVGKECS